MPAYDSGECDCEAREDCPTEESDCSPPCECACHGVSR